MITKTNPERHSAVSHNTFRSAALWLFSLTALVPLAAHASVQLAWDAVDDDRVGLYQVWYGTSSGNYDTRIDSTTTTATVNEVTRDTNYYFVVRACTADASRCSAYSNEIQYIDENDVPVASNDSATLAEGSDGIDINVLANDSDGDGDTLSVSVASASSGSVSINPNGTLRYSAPVNFFGSDSISYTVVDGYSGSDTGLVSITVTGVNDAPSASNDSATVAEDTTNSAINVLSNDTDVDGDNLSVTDATANRGTVSINANGTLSYRPPANYFGSATLSYTISDGNGGTASANVAVTVTGVNDSHPAPRTTPLQSPKTAPTRPSPFLPMTAISTGTA
jgi:VCBS repeat-containing protein